MGSVRGRNVLRVGTVLGVVAAGVVWQAGSAQALSFTGTPPTRLYMAPQGTTLFAGLVGVPIGTLEFGPGPDDLISGDTRDINVAAEVGPIGCDTLTDQPVGVPDYDLDDCPRLQMDVLHGRLKLQNATQLFRDYLTDPDGAGPLVAGDPDPSDVVWRLPGGAIVSQIGGGGDPNTPNDPNGHTLYHLSGLEDQINDALDNMSYVPDSGYYYTNSAPEERLHMDLVSGDPNVPSVSHDVEIRVLDVNDAASLTGPASAAAQPEVELFLPAVAPGLTWPYAGSLWTVADADNDEVVDDDTGQTLPDGAGDKMLLVGYLDCGVPTVDEQTGFRLRGGSFQADQNDIESLLADFYGLTGAPTELQDAIQLLLDALDAIQPGLTNIPLATSDPFIYNDIFAGIGTIDDVAYALSQVRFLSNAENDTCTLYTVVSDLGNNGLPLQYIGDPPTGIEVPWLGIPPIDIVATDITVGGLQQIEVAFDPAAQFVLEGTTATATILIDPPTHPEFDLRIATVDGTAMAGADYQGVSPFATITVPADAATATFDTNVFNDAPPAEGNETFLFTLTVPTDPPGSPGGFSRPFGYEVVATQSTQTVTILDEDDAAATVTSFADASLVEGDSGTSDMVFTVGLDQPADGTESVSVAATPGTATNPEDFGDPVPTTVTFAVGATSATIVVPIVGDLFDEGDHDFTLTLSNPTNVTIGDATATGTILDDDGPRTASIADASVTEGDAGTKNLSFTVSLDHPAKGTESLAVSTADGAPGAVAPGDYAALSNVPVTFAPGATTATVNVVVNGDTSAEPDETFSVTLSNPTNVTIGDGAAIGTITNDDILVTTDAAASVDENASSTFEVQITPAVHPAFTLTGTLASITATPGTDYDDSVSPISIAVPADAATVNVPISALGDFVADDGEQYSVGVVPATDPAGFTVRTGSPSTVTVTINDVPPADSVISLADVTVAEGAVASVAVTNTFPARVCQVSVTTIPGTATSPGDYTAIPGALFDVNGDPIDVVTNDDLEIEPDETFSVSITLVDPPAPGCVIGDGVATVTITSDDVPMEVSIDDGTVVEGALANLAVHVSAAVAPYCAVSVTTAAVPPTSVSDFTPIPGSTFIANDVDAIAVEALQDLDDDDGETFTVTLALTGSSDPRCVIVDGQATVTIIDDDGPTDTTPPTVTVNQAAGQADPTADAPILFTVVFSEPVTGFEASDLLLDGTAGPTSANVTGSGTTYTVAVGGMPGPGTVIVSVPAGAAADGALNASLASTSTDNVVTYAPDVAAPLTIDVPDDIVRGNDPGKAGADVDFPAATASGGTPPTTVTCDRSSGEFFPIGTTTVNCTAVDSEAAAPQERFVETTVTASFTITVVDTEPPVIADLPDLVRGATTASGTTVTFPLPTATDNAGTPTVVCAPISGSQFRIGASTVTCTATDGAGNTATSSFRVTVTSPGSGVPATGSDSTAVLLIAALFLAAGFTTRRIGRRT